MNYTCNFAKSNSVWTCLSACLLLNKIIGWLKTDEKKPPSPDYMYKKVAFVRELKK